MRGTRDAFQGEGTERCGAKGGRALCRAALPVPAALLLVALAGCHPRGADPVAGRPAAAAPAGIRFERVTDVAGIRFRHQDGSTGRKYFVETMGPGCAFLDYDGDGW